MRPWMQQGWWRPGRTRRPERGDGGGGGVGQRLERAGAGEGDEQAHPRSYAKRGGRGGGRELVCGRHGGGGPRRDAQATGGEAACGERGRG
ncbi:hypothetical protein GQ55_1G422000 [Panicum hallii var. hallii]|uniref:Uncharacterized protein n=1 Tax=Panicum hallii var. hallii TaxID=1504633 RepID=A0A2T7FD90_9POAL|nr:hypothetical protein GQ55_1G422000 [Panicum hallii var. hallii]